MPDIDKDKLRELANDPNLSAKDIYAAFGYKSDVGFYAQINQDPELKSIYREGRDAVKGGRGAKISAKRGSPKKTSTPPPQWEYQSIFQGSISQAPVGFYQ